MKRSVLVGVMGIAALCAGARAGEWETQGVLDHFFPSGDLWEGYALGGELKGVLWATPRWGIGLAAGYTQWDVDDRDTAISGLVTDTWGGHASYIPLGASILARLGDGTSRATVTLEGGLRYMICDSQVEVTRTTIIPGDAPDRESFDLDCDDGIVGRLGVGIRWRLNDAERPMALYLACGYQFDLDKGDATEDSWLDLSEEIELEAFYVETGLVIPIR